MPTRFSFGKAEKLKSRKQIEALFLEGKNFSIFPLRIMYRVIPGSEDPTVQVGVSVGKRYFKKAVHRNRIKRLLREAYRLQKEQLLQEVINQKVLLNIFLIYTGKTLPAYTEIKPVVAACLEELEKRIFKKNANPR